MEIKGILVTMTAPFENHRANGGENILGNVPSIKKRPDDKCYVSGQMQRHVLFSSIDRFNSDYQRENHITAKDDKHTFVSNADGITGKIESDLRADMGGFLHTIDGIGSIRRTSPISVTPAVATNKSDFGRDLLVRLNQNVNTTDQAIVSTEYSKEDDMCMNFFLDVTSLSMYKTYKYEGNLHVSTECHKFAYEVERKRRAELFLNATRFMNDYANQARNAVCGEPQKVLIVFDNVMSRKASRYFKAGDKEKENILAELEDRGATYFLGDDTQGEKSVLKAYKEALKFLDENKLYCDKDDTKIETFDDVYTALKRQIEEANANKNQKKGKGKKAVSSKDTSDITENDE